jgi:antitoxin (DNA-binding transcriptional repressor) of toxin-antitoxin stability system
MYSMRRYPVSVARERLADILDAADAGQRVVIERRGVRYIIEAEKRRRPATPPRPPALIKVLDESLRSGEWTWRWRDDGLAFAPQRATRR